MRTVSVFSTVVFFSFVFVFAIFASASDLTNYNIQVADDALADAERTTPSSSNGDHSAFCFDFETEASLLRLAVNTCDLSQIFRILEEHRFPLLAPIYQGLPVLAYATATGIPQVLPLIIHYYRCLGIDLNAAFIVQNIRTCALAYATNAEVFNYLVGQGARIDFLIADLERGNSFNWVHLAVLNASPVILEALIYHGADLTERTSTGYVALQLCSLVEKSTDDVLKLYNIRIIEEILSIHLKK